MSITSELRSCADTARDRVIGIAGKAGVDVDDLRAQAEQAVNLDAIKTAIEPYLAQAKGYAGTVTDRAEELLSSAANDARVARLVAAAESVAGVVLETVQDRVLQPVRLLTGQAKPAPDRTAEPAANPTSAAEPTADRTAEPAAAKGAKPAAAKGAAARKPAARKSAARTGSAGRSSTSA